MTTATNFDVSKLLKQVSMFQKQVEILCEPIFRFFGIQYFEFYRVYPDDSFIILTTHPVWVEHYYANCYYTTTDVDCHNRLSQYDFIFWDNWPQEDTAVWQVNEEANKLNLTNAITLIIKFPEAVNAFTFGAPIESKNIYNRYLANMSVLEKFCYHFLSKANHIICEADKLKSRLPNFDERVKEKKFNIKNQILDSLEIENLSFLVNNQNVALSRQETKIAIHCLQGISSKLIAKKLNLSSKTIEWHIENMKKKLNCFSKSQLCDVLSKNPAIIFMLKSA